jgi:hypothetical protein
MVRRGEASAREAATMILAWSRQLDEQGLTRAPAAYRTDATLALTFEDVANGPAKRWRQEGLALVHVCTEAARSENVDTAAAHDCATMRRTYARAVEARVATDAGACGCHPGDPLCSVTMNGWCPPR